MSTTALERLKEWVRGDVLGWFDTPGQKVPTHDAPHDAACPFCGCAAGLQDVITATLEPLDVPGRRYFFRVHRRCFDGATDDERSAPGQAIVDLLEIRRQMH